MHSLHQSFSKMRGVNCQLQACYMHLNSSPRMTWSLSIFQLGTFPWRRGYAFARPSRWVSNWLLCLLVCVLRLNVEGRMIWRLRTTLTTVCTASANGRRSLTWKETITHCITTSPFCSLGREIWPKSCLSAVADFNSFFVFFPEHFSGCWSVVILL